MVVSGRHSAVHDKQRLCRPECPAGGGPEHGRACQDRCKQVIEWKCLPDPEIFIAPAGSSHNNSCSAGCRATQSAISGFAVRPFRGSCATFSAPEGYRQKSFPPSIKQQHETINYYIYIYIYIYIYTQVFLRPPCVVQEPLDTVEMFDTWRSAPKIDPGGVRKLMMIIITTTITTIITQLIITTSYYY